MQADLEANTEVRPFNLRSFGLNFFKGEDESNKNTCHVSLLKGMR